MMKNTMMTVAILSLCTTSALAGKRGTSLALPSPKAAAAKPAPKAPVVKPLATDMAITEIDTNLNFGGDYGVLDRSHDMKQATEKEHTLKIKPLDGTIGQSITPQRLADIEYCWDRLPSAKRSADTTATIKLAIEASGSVALASVTGEKLDGEFKKCVVAASNRWRFPVEDNASEIEYAVALRTTTLNR